MDQISSELKKILMAGIGAVSTGVEKSQQVISQLAEKGEQTYEQAKVLSQKAAVQVKKAYDDSGLADFFSSKVKKETIAEDLESLPAEDLTWLRDQLDQLIEMKQAEEALKKVSEPDTEAKAEAQAAEKEPGEEAEADEQTEPTDETLTEAEIQATADTKPEIEAHNETESSEEDEGRKE